MKPYAPLCQNSKSNAGSLKVAVHCGALAVRTDVRPRFFIHTYVFRLPAPSVFQCCGAWECHLTAATSLCEMVAYVRQTNTFAEDTPAFSSGARRRTNVSFRDGPHRTRTLISRTLQRRGLTPWRQASDRGGRGDAKGPLAHWPAR